MTPAKRNASRSPDGANEHKKASRASKDVGERRQKSSKNDNLVNSSADPRKRMDKNNTSVLSPISTDGSPYQDPASARSTPQRQQPRPQTALMTTTPSTPINNDDNALQAPLRDSIATLVSSMAKDVSLRASYELAKHKSEGADAVYQKMEPHFQKYPAIEERTTNDKSKAGEIESKLKQQLNLNSNAQATLATSLFEAMWNISSKAGASAQVQGLHPDAVSRKEYDMLQAQFQEQQQLLSQQQDRFEKQASLIEKLEKTVAEMGGAVVKSKELASTTDRNTKIVTALETKVREMESTVSNQKSFIEQCQTNIARNKAGLISQEKAMDAIDRSVKSNYTASLEDLAKADSRVGVIKNEVDQIWKEISEQGKPSVLERLKSHDQKINSLSTRLDLSTKSVDPERLKQLDGRLKSLNEDLVKVKDARVQELREATARRDELAAASTEKSSPFDKDAFKKEVVDDATELVTELSEAFDSHTSKIDNLQEALGSLQKQVEDAGHAHQNQIQQVDEAHDAKHASIREDHGKILANIAAYKNEADSLRSDVASLERTVRSLRDRPSPAATNGSQAVQFRPITTQPPSVNSSVMGVPPGGMHAPNVVPPNGSPVDHNMTNGISVAPNNHNVKVLQDQMSAVWGNISSLRQRYDNLTTEEVVKAMVDQCSKMYPAAKDFQKAVNALQASHKTLDGRLNTFENNLKVLRHNLTESAVSQHEFRDWKTGVGSRLQELQSGITAAGSEKAQLRDEITKMVKDAEKRVDAAVGCQTDAILKLRSKVKALVIEAFGEDSEGEGGE